MLVSDEPNIYSLTYYRCTAFSFGALISLGTLGPIYYFAQDKPSICQNQMLSNGDFSCYDAMCKTNLVTICENIFKSLQSAVITPGIAALVLIAKGVKTMYHTYEVQKETLRIAETRRKISISDRLSVCESRTWSVVTVLVIAATTASQIFISSFFKDSFFYASLSNCSNQMKYCPDRMPYDLEQEVLNKSSSVIGSYNKLVVTIFSGMLTAGLIGFVYRRHMAAQKAFTDVVGYMDRNNVWINPEAPEAEDNLEV